VIGFSNSEDSKEELLLSEIFSW